MKKKQQRETTNADALPTQMLAVAEQIARVKAILVHHAIVAAHASWMPSLQPYEQRGVSWTLADAVQALLPERTVLFDMESISADTGYTAVIECFARATNGEWQPRDVAWKVNRRSATVEITFRSGHEQPRWQFPQERDWVTPAFLGRLGKFLDDRLTGIFVPVPRWGQSYMAVYLPRRAGQELAAFFQRLGQPGIQDRIILSPGVGQEHRRK